MNLYVVIGLAPTAPMAELNAAMGRYIAGDEEGDGIEVVEDGGRAAAGGNLPIRPWPPRPADRESGATVSQPSTRSSGFVTVCDLC